MATSKRKPDWLDEHLVFIGVSDDQADNIKDQVRTELSAELAEPEPEDQSAPQGDLFS